MNCRYSIIFNTDGAEVRLPMSGNPEFLKWKILGGCIQA
jgi:hypothetical protein